MLYDVYENLLNMIHVFILNWEYFPCNKCTVLVEDHTMVGELKDKFYKYIKEPFTTLNFRKSREIIFFFVALKNCFQPEISPNQFLYFLHQG